MSGTASTIPNSSPASSSATQATILIELNKMQEEQLLKYASSAQQSLTTQYNMRSEMEEIDRTYMREKDWTDDQIKSRIANRKGDSDKFQNITVPIVMPQVQSALSYLANVFVTGYPIFPVTADPQNEDAAMQLETIITENAQTAGWAQQMVQFFRDGLKYNLHALECDWEQRTTWTVGNNLKGSNSAGGKKMLWAGNVLRRMDLYNTFWDPRVHPSEMHSNGEYVGFTEIYSRVRFKAFMNALHNKVPVNNVERALASLSIQGGVGSNTGSSPFGYYQPIINPFPFYNRQAGVDWMAWAFNKNTTRNGTNFPGIYNVTKLYARIIPSDYDLKVPEKNTPQVWKFIIVNGKVILSAERMTNIHGFIPVFFGQPIEDGLDYQTKSFANNVSDMQSIASSMWNGYIASKRRLIGDRVLYDPSRIREQDINNRNPAAKIPVRPSAYGKPMQDAVYQFPFRDEQTESLIQGSGAVINFANLINGQNPATQGQFVKGNKTRHEYDDVMGHGNGQNQLMAISVETQVFTPMKEVIKLNTMQYQQQGTIYNTGKGVSVNVDPTDLRKSAVHFKVSDGLIPSDKVTGDDMLQSVVQALSQPNSPLAGGFNLPPMFTYLMKTQGLDLTPFAKSQAQLQYEQAMGQWQQAAATAAKSGSAFNTPQPQPSPQLQQEMQQQQKSGGVGETPTAAALESTQGGAS